MKTLLLLLAALPLLGQQSLPTNYTTLQWDQDVVAKLPTQCGAPGFFYATDTKTFYSCDLTGHFIIVTGNNPSSAGLIGFDQSNVYPSGSVGRKLQQVVSVTDAPYLARGDGIADDTTAIQSAIDAVCSGSSPAAVFFPAGTYRITAALTFTGQFCSFVGSNRGGSIIKVTPSFANTDGVTFIHSGTAQFSNGIFHMTITAANTNVRRVVSLAAQDDFTMDDVTINGQQATVALYMVGMQTSAFHHILVGGPNSGTGDAILIDSTPTSTTVTFDSQTDIEGSFGGACLHAKGSSGATSITFSDSTMENCIYGVEAETGVVIHHSHIEFSHISSYYVPTGSSALIQSDGNNIQQTAGFPGTTIFTLSGGTVMYSANDVTDLVAGSTLYAAPTGAKVYTSGPQFPYGIFPEGTLNSGDPNAISAGVLAQQSFTSTGVSGDYRAQLFRGNYYNVAMTGDTAIHINGASNNLPAGEKITFHLTRNGNVVASTSNSLTNDIPIIGQINPNGPTSNSYQDVITVMNSTGSAVIQSSPGWVTTSNGSGAPAAPAVGPILSVAAHCSSTADTTLINSALGTTGALVYLPIGCTSKVGLLAVSANNVTLDCQWGTLSAIAGTTGAILTGTGVSNFTMQKCIVDGGNIDTLTQLAQFINSSNINLDKNIFQHSGLPTTITATMSGISGTAQVSDVLYVGASFGAATKKATLLSCSPSCSSPTSFIVNMTLGYFVASDSIKDNGPGNITGTISGTTAHFAGGVQYFQTSGNVTNTIITDVAGYGLDVSGPNTGFAWSNVHISYAYKNCAYFNGTIPTTLGGLNYVDHCYDYGAASLGAYGNGAYLTGVHGGVIAGLQASYTEYSGLRLASASNVKITGFSGYKTGDWCVYLADFNVNNSQADAPICDTMLGGGVAIQNAGDDLAFGNSVVGANLYNALGSSTNAGVLGPVFSEGIRGDGEVLISNNAIDGAYYGAVCDNGENIALANYDCEISGNRITDTRPVTITVTGTSGSVVGSQINVGTDKLYVGASLSTAGKVGAVISCIPISSGATCTSPTSITLRMLKGFFTAADSIVDAGPSGNLTGTVGTVTGTAIYNLTLASSINFPLFANVQVGSGNTAFNGFVTCATNVVTSTGCPTANHITVAGSLNAAGLMVPAPASGTITNTDSSTTGTISARTAIPVNMQVGVMAAKFDTTTTCSILVDGNKISGYAIQPIGGIQDSAGVPDGTVVNLGPGTCVVRSPGMGNGPSITSGFGTSPSLVAGPPTDIDFTVNVGTGGVASSGVVTFGVPYTAVAPTCVATDSSTAFSVKATASTTTLTLAVTTAFASGDLVAVHCGGGR